MYIHVVISESKYTVFLLPTALFRSILPLLDFDVRFLVPSLQTSEGGQREPRHWSVPVPSSLTIHDTHVLHVHVHIYTWIEEVRVETSNAYPIIDMNVCTSI